MQLIDKTLSEKAYLAIRQQVRAGKLPPGSRLVNRTLAGQLGLSQTPVREAINRLASEGLVEYVRGLAAYVRRFSREDLAQMYDLRMVIEPFAVEQAATHATEGDQRQLRKHCLDSVRLWRQFRHDPALGKSQEFRDRWNDNEVALHTMVVKASGNRWLIQVVDNMRLVHEAFMAQRSQPDLMSPAEVRSTCRDHLRLYRFLRHRQANEAAQLMREHIAHGRKCVLALIDSSSSESH